jgi:hypothetical protein
MTSLRRIPATILAFTVVLASLAAWSAQAADPLSGTWKENVAKSTYSPGPAPKVAGTTRIEVAQGGVKLVNDAVNAQGQAVHQEYTAKFDGKDYPLTATLDGKPNPNAADAISWKKIDDYTYENTGKLKGQALTTTHMMVSKDGKTRTNMVSGKNAQGQVVKNTVVYEKQ